MAIVLRDVFRAMGCGVKIEVFGGDVSHLATARRSLEHLEKCWSRFLPDSDVSRLNAADGTPVAVDPFTIVLVDAMVQGNVATDGAFDPTLLAPLVGLGYSASWRDPSAFTSVPAGSLLKGNIRDTRMDSTASVVQLPPGTIVDAGGVGKGLAADLVVAELLAAGAQGAMVNIGGDVFMSGEGPSDGDWLIGVADALDDEVEVLQLALRSGGVATSGTFRRAWVAPDGTAAHHLLDPATSRPAGGRCGEAPVVQATVVAGSGMWAEVFTKSIVIGGLTSLRQLNEMGLGARAVLTDGTVHCNATWESFVRAPTSAEDRCTRN